MMMRYDRFDSRLKVVCEFCRTRAMRVEDVIMPAACLCMLHAYTLYACIVYAACRNRLNTSGRTIGQFVICQFLANFFTWMRVEIMP